MRSWILFFIFFPVIGFLHVSLAGNEVDFRADFYQRDLSKNTVKGQGKAWMKWNGKQIWADQLEYDFSTKFAAAQGNVHITVENAEIWCSHANYDLAGDEATLDNAVVIIEQLVITGNSIRKFGKNRYIVNEGTYSNCNVKLIKSGEIEKCGLDWKIHGRILDLTLEEYAHAYDSIAYVKQLPILYSPYLIFPAKSKRQSGLLFPSLSSSADLGSGFTSPLFLALDPWHDLTLYPSYYSNTGYHLGLHYRYTYSYDKMGDIKFSFTERRFSDDRSNPAPDNPSRERTLGIIGEWALYARNKFHLSDKTKSFQVIQLLSHPYYSQDYEPDIGPSVQLSFLHSQLSLTHTTDKFLTTAQVQHHQSLIISKDWDVDEGSVTQVPNLSASFISSPIINKFLFWEWDTFISNFYRKHSFDGVPASPVTTGSNLDETPGWDNNDFLRTGQRLRTEPRLVLNVPMPPGFQFQPVVRTGSSVYHFDTPESSLIHREYLEAELPFSLYLSKSFETGIPNLEKVSHVFQPRIIYAVRPLQSLSAEHPFFCQDPTTGNYVPGICSDQVGDRANPRFDIHDFFSKYEYLRFELINRFRKKTSSGISRFFLLQASQKYNLRTFNTDPRFTRRLGPLELLADLTLWRFSSQLQASYELETVPDVNGEQMHENYWSGALAYSAPEGSNVKLSTLLRNKANRSFVEQSLYLGFYKSLPTFFDLEGSFEYSLKHGELLSYQTGFHFGSKPRSCWKLILFTGRDSLKRPFTRIDFKLSFGEPSDFKRL